MLVTVYQSLCTFPRFFCFFVCKMFHVKVQTLLVKRYIAVV